MNPIAFMTANYVARQVDYNMTEGWGQGDRTTQEHFKPIATFAPRFEAYLQDIVAMGFTNLDIWTGILHPSWATAEHITAANTLLAQYNLPVFSLAGWFGSTPEEFTQACQLAAALNCPILGGTTSMLETDRSFVVEMLQQYGLKLALENHPEKTPDELLSKIGDPAGGIIGAAVDTGWFGTQGYDAAQALEELRAVLIYVHLKDIRAAGKHETCRFGEGIVPIQACVATLQRIGYQGGVCVEHEPEHADPTEDCVASLALLKGWLAQ